MIEDKFKPGTKVVACVPDDTVIKYFHDRWNDTAITGTILDKAAEEGKVWVVWDTNDHFDEDDELEVSVDVLTLVSDLPQIEEDYKALNELIKENMNVAARLILESNKLAKRAHAKSLESMYDAVSPLINAMDASGWRSSSWGC